MPRPSSGWAVPLKANPLGALNDRDINLLTLPPSRILECRQEAMDTLGEKYRHSSEIVRAAIEGVAWRRYGTSYIVDELIGGPWD